MHAALPAVSCGHSHTLPLRCIHQPMAWQRDHCVALLLGVVAGWLGVHLLLPDRASPTPTRIYPSRYVPSPLATAAAPALTAGLDSEAEQRSPASADLYPPPSPPMALDANSSLFAECVERVEEGSTSPDDIVLAVLTTVKRHDLIQTLRGHWLRDVKALLLTDAPGLSETAKHKVVVWQGDPNCGAADRGAPALYYANLTWWGEYKWIIMVDDDVLVSTENLAAFLSMRGQRLDP